MGKRILVAIPIGVVVIMVVFLQGWALAIFAVALACACQFEVVRAMDKNGKPLVKWISYLFAALSAGLFLLSFGETAVRFLTPAIVLALFVVLTMAAFITAMFFKKYTEQSVLYTGFTMIYPQLFMILFYSVILDAGQGPRTYGRILFLLLMIFLPAMFSDTAAYFIGKTFGRRKLCPTISPKKTVAGSIAGVVGGVVAALLIFLLFDNAAFVGGSPIIAPIGNYLITGMILASLSQLGDLAASYLKRALAVKDFGRLLPGHGGIVDRMDSVLFCIPLVYILTSIFDIF
jgi:phosphatidate cytidylyltransferase